MLRPTLHRETTMRVTNNATLRLLSAATSDALPVSELVVDGSVTGKRVTGAILETALAWESFHLLLLTDDVPYEEALRVVLLDSHLDVLDEAEIGAPYCTGTFSSLAVCGADSVKFLFMGDTSWTVQVLPERQLRVPLWSERRGVQRRFGLWRHFIVS